MLIRELVTRFGFDVEQNKLEKLDGNIKKLSLGLSAAGAAMLALPTLMVRSRQGTEQALGGLASVGVTELDALEARAKQFSNRWAGFTKQAFIEAAYVTKSALSGLSDEAVGEFTALAALTAKATKASLDEMIVTFASGYGIFKPLFKEMSDIEWAKEFTAQVSKTANIFNSDGKKISAALVNLGASASAANIPMNEQLAILGALQGVSPGSESGTLYKSFILNAGKAGKALNLSFTDGQGRLKGILQILETIRKKFPDIANAAAAAELKEAFGSDESYRFIVQLLEQMDQLKSGIDDVAGASRDGTRAAEEMAEAMQRGMGGTLLMQQIQNLFETLGKPLQPTYEKALKAISRWVIKLDELADKNPKLVKGLMLTIGALGALFVAFGTLLAGAVAAGGAMTWLGTVAAAAGVGVGVLVAFLLAIPLAIAATLIGMAVLYLILEDIWNWVNGNKSALGELIGSWEDFKDKVVMLSELAVDGIKAAWSALPGFFSDLWGGIVGTVEGAYGKLDRFLSKSIPSYDSFWDGIGQSWNNFMTPVAPSAYRLQPAAAGAGGGAVTKNYNVQSTATIQVPPGTMEAQQQAIKDAAELAFQDKIGDILRQASGDYPEHE